jgi:hypothetical protein
MTEAILARIRILRRNTFGAQALEDAVHGRPLEMGVAGDLREPQAGMSARRDDPQHVDRALYRLGAGVARRGSRPAASARRASAGRTGLAFHMLE